jgi:hypothetical protein
MASEIDGTSNFYKKIVANGNQAVHTVAVRMPLS